MLHFEDTLGSERIRFHYVQNTGDLNDVAAFCNARNSLGIDTESTGVNCYRPGWKLRSVQIANATDSYVVPARFKRFIAWLIVQPINWIGHNGPHDIRSIDAWLGYDTRVVCAGETYIPAHHADSRKQDDGGIGHGLKEQAIRHISRDAGKWEVTLKKAFKEIKVPIPGEVYKAGKRKGEQKMRTITLGEGWSLIDPAHPAYIAYAAADPLLTYRLWKFYQPVVRQNYDLYEFDHRVQMAGDKLQRRRFKLDKRYTEALNDALTFKAELCKRTAAEYGCENINSGQQIANTLLGLGVELTARTPKGAFKTDDKILRSIDVPEALEFIGAVLGAKQLLKRRESYTESFLREMDAQGGIHPSINTLAARTTRMSISEPPLQQLPTKDREEEA